MHLAIDAEQRPIGVDDRGGIVIDARRAPLEQRADDDDAQLAREAAERIGGRSRNGFGQIEQRGVFLAAEILRAEQFLQADDLRAPARGLADAPHGFGEVFVRVHGAGHLDEADAKLGGVHQSILTDRRCDIIISSPMTRRLAAAALCLAAACRAAVPTPAQHFGFTPGDDYKLADSSQIFGYFHKLAASSDRIHLEEFGRSSEGRPMYVAFISAPENLKKLDRYRQISARLALGQATAEEARALAEEGSAIVWIDSGLHATEVAPAQQAPLLAYKMLTDESAEVEAIRRNVILMQVPVINPDGLDMVAQWYRKNVGTPYETAPMPWLFQKYAGHDNNRDWFMLNLEETRHVTRLLFREWFPQIVYNQHQAPPFPARIFVPPYAEPLNPDIPAAVMEGINLLGAAMRERFAREDKSGVLSYFGFDAWWNGGLRSAPAFHNMHGILTETAGNTYANPNIYQARDFQTAFGNGAATREPSMFYARPWMGGKWSLRDAIEYMLTADMAILTRSRRAPHGFPAEEFSNGPAVDGRGRGGAALRLRARRATVGLAGGVGFSGTAVAGRDRSAAGARALPREWQSVPGAGTLVILAAQPFRPYLIDLLEPQRYPELKEKPYDITGWTLPMQMGVSVDRLDERFDADLEPVSEFRAHGSVEGRGAVLLLDHRENDAFLATAFFLDREGTVRWASDGTIAVDSAYVENAARADNFARQFSVSVTLAETAPKPAYELRRPRVALYQPWTANSDEGWTEWLLDRYRVPYALIHNDDFAKGELRAAVRQHHSGIANRHIDSERLAQRRDFRRIAREPRPTWWSSGPSTPAA